MEIKTKYNVGDEIWVAASKAPQDIKCKECNQNKPNSGRWIAYPRKTKIVGLDITIDGFSHPNPRIMYYVASYETIYENNIILTKEECQKICDLQNGVK